jgi:hypothetical protein
MKSNIRQQIVYISLIIICSSISWFVSSSFESNSWERDAVRRGYGVWAFDENGSTQFKWK